MKVIRLVGLAIVAVLAVSLAVAATASASPYLFRASNVENTFLGLSLPGTIKAGADTIACNHDIFAGAIASVHLAGPFDITFRQCVSAGSGGSGCPVNSPGAAPGEILTKTLHALLGLVLPAIGLGLGGLLVLPTSGKQFVTLEGNSCTPETIVTGNVAGLLEDSQVGHLVLDNLVLFIPKDITKIDTLNGLVEPELIAFTELATLETVVHIKWHKDTEIEVP
jgi:hypothetical protein